MSESLNELGVTVMHLERLTIHIIPILQEMNDRLVKGEQLDHWDIQTLNEEFENTKQFGFLAERHPEHHELYTELAHLCKEVANLALMNEESLQYRNQ